MAENLAENQWYRSLKTTHPPNFYKAIILIGLPTIFDDYIALLVNCELTMYVEEVAQS